MRLVEDEMIIPEVRESISAMTCMALTQVLLSCSQMLTGLSLQYRKGTTR